MIVKSTTELAAILGVSLPTVAQWRGRGMPYKMKGPTRYEYNKKEVLKWLHSHPRYKDWLRELAQSKKI